MRTGSQHSSWVSTRPCRPVRARAASSAASQAATSGRGATAHPSTSRGAVGLVQSAVTGTVTYPWLSTLAIVTRQQVHCGTWVSDTGRTDDQPGPHKP